MKVYFLGAVSGLSEYGNTYNKIVKILEENDNSVISEHVLGVASKEVSNLSEEFREEYFKKMEKSIKSSDVMVAEISKPTVNIGYEIAYAIEKDKPVLVLYKESTKVFPLLIGNTSDKLEISAYQDESDLERVILRGLRELRKKADIRFNFFISPEISNYLDWVSKIDRIPRSVYLRKLIEEDMQSHKDYDATE